MLLSLEKAARSCAGLEQGHGQTLRVLLSVFHPDDNKCQLLRRKKNCNNHFVQNANSSIRSRVVFLAKVLTDQHLIGTAGDSHGLNVETGTAVEELDSDKSSGLFTEQTKL